MSLITLLYSSALHFPLLSPQPPTVASTLHPATAFWLLLPCDSPPFVSVLLSLICASPEGQAHFSATRFISCLWKTMIALLPLLSVTGNFFPFSLQLFFFFFSENHQWFVFTFFHPKYQLNNSFCRMHKDVGDWKIPFRFLSYVFVVWKRHMYFCPDPFFFFCELPLTKNDFSLASNIFLSINHSCGFSANSSFIDLDFHSHLKHFVLTLKFLEVLSLSCFALLLNTDTLPPTNWNLHGQSQS